MAGETGMREKTVLEQLIFHGRKNAIGICRELSISPQQFTDWIKGRRPVPADRLRLLSTYFGVPQEIIADEKRYARELTTALSVELEMLALRTVCAKSAGEECAKAKQKLDQLAFELTLRQREERFARILKARGSDGLNEIDAVLDTLENEDRHATENMKQKNGE